MSQCFLQRKFSNGGKGWLDKARYCEHHDLIFFIDKLERMSKQSLHFFLSITFLTLAQL